ncbi:nonsense-mediated mRNA decay factor SMG5-like isoform X2 [Tachypleus tridentatus]|uniref:nonsense-mediated mRNA decay factor SMG5-like isoform X2 n=1 Tax=Tachypleus tridentatus TaxID=6853 RepID=UPI003FD4285D
MLKLVIQFPSVDSADSPMWLCYEKNTHASSISKRSLVEQELTPSVVEVIKIINQEGLLPGIKVVADWQIINSDIIVTYGEVFLCIQCLHNFGQLLARLPKTGVNFNSEKECFTASSTEKSFSGAVSTEAGVEQPVGQRKQMMWNMAHLWLKAEVNDLESKVKGGGFPQLSSYLVPDISSFCQHLALLKQLRLFKRFVIVVPSVVTASLDERQKESVGAREAIRWLKNELRHGTSNQSWIEDQSLQVLVSRPRMFKLRPVARILKTRPQAINQKIRTTLQHPSVISCLTQIANSSLGYFIPYYL